MTVSSCPLTIALLCGAGAGFVVGCALTWTLANNRQITATAPKTANTAASTSPNTKLQAQTTTTPETSPITAAITAAAQDHKIVCELSPTQIARFSRHVILRDFGPASQARLLHSSVLVIGTGGLAATLVPILAAAGVGRLGLVDDDVVEESNLQRQIFFSESDAHTRKPKVEAMAQRIRDLNSSVSCDVHQVRVTHANALELVSQYDIVIDASDNMATRYLVNDACVLAHKPLVSGAAQGLQGQLSVYRKSNSRAKGLSCYRCNFPEPPVSAHQSNCNDAGVLSPVPALVGCLQALEAIKVLVENVDGEAPNNNMRALDDHILSLDLSDLSSGGWFMGKKKHSRRAKCELCGDLPTITNMHDSLAFAQQHKLVDAVCEARTRATVATLPSSLTYGHVTPMEYVGRWLLLAQNDPVTHKLPHVLDVRPSNEFAICSLKHARNLPLPRLESACKRFGDEEWMDNVDTEADAGEDEVRLLLQAVSVGTPVVIVCHRGNDSQRACELLVSDAIGLPAEMVFNMSGGLAAWSRTVDPNFPTY